MILKTVKISETITPSIFGNSSFDGIKIVDSLRASKSISNTKLLASSSIKTDITYSMFASMSRTKISVKKI